jgi:hypothetical protein
MPARTVDGSERVQFCDAEQGSRPQRGTANEHAEHYYDEDERELFDCKANEIVPSAINRRHLK